jgi:hypothetical protein
MVRKSSGGYFSKEIFKHTFTPAVPYNTYVFHTSNKGQQCIPYKAAGVTIEVPVDSVYIGTNKGVGTKINGVEIYTNKQWITI